MNHLILSLFPKQVGSVEVAFASDQVQILINEITMWLECNSFILLARWIAKNQGEKTLVCKKVSRKEKPDEAMGAQHVMKVHEWGGLIAVSAQEGIHAGAAGQLA